MEPWISHCDPNGPYHNQLSEEEVLLLNEREALTKAVEELSLRRQAVAAACRIAEEEVRRKAQEAEAHSCGTEAASELKAVDDRGLDEAEAHTRFSEPLRDLTAKESQWIEESGSCAPGEQHRLAKRPTLRTKAAADAQEHLALERRLRAEIEVLAAAQKKNIDAARAQVSLSRNSNLAQAPRQYNVEGTRHDKMN